MIGHGRVVCSCGNVIVSCRCPESHRVREVRQHPACGREAPIQETTATVRIESSGVYGQPPLVVDDDLLYCV